MAKSFYGSFYRPHKRVHAPTMIMDPKTGEFFEPPSMTKQEFVRECDVNNIIKSYSATGQISHINAKAAQGAFLDLPDALDFQDSLQVIKAAEAAFMALPSQVRRQHGDDPGRFLDWITDPANLDEARRLGLANPLPAPAAPPEPQEAKE